MRLLYLLLLLPALILAQTDPVYEAYKVWDKEHHSSDYRSRMQSLFEVSADWIAKWPDSGLAWQQRRDSLLGTQNHSAELWKQAGRT